MSNKEIAGIFEHLAKLMELHQENPFKIRAYHNGALQIKKLEKPLSETDLNELKVPGIGEAILKKIETIVATGELPLLNKYLEQTPPGVVEMLDLKGIGAKKVALIWKELGVETLEDLEKACLENQLITLKGFSTKTQEELLEGVRFIQKYRGFYLYADAEEIVLPLFDQLKTAFPKNKISFTGDYRRQMPTLNQLDILCDLAEAQLVPWLEGQGFKIADKASNLISVLKPGYPKIQFHIDTTKGFYHTLFKTTGGDQFLTEFTKDFIIPDFPETETDIFKKNNLAEIPACLREEPWILNRARENKIPELIQTKDIKGIIHCHSNYSDGQVSLREMTLAIKAKGFEYMVITDHSKAAAYANGLQPERILQQHAEIDQLNHELAPFHIFKGIESDILGDGSLDYEPEILKSFDVVIASVHSNLKMDEAKAMKRLLKAIENPCTTILGHLTGRLLLSRKGFPVDHKKVIEACVAHNVVIEINAHPIRLDLDWSWIHYALEKGALLSINPDAHSIDGIDMIRFGVLAAQKGGLAADKNLSSKSLKEFRSFLS